MITLFLRTLIIYFALLFSIRLMGKRQIGELQVTEFIVTFMLSELATMPIIDKSAPVSYAIVPILLLLSLEVIFSFIISKLPSLKKIFFGSPGVLICRGKIMQHELAKNRIDINELLAELRLKDIADPSDVEYAILEDNGKLSVIKKACASPATPDILSRTVKEPGVAHPIIICGTVSDIGLKMAERSVDWLRTELRRANTSVEDVFLLTVDDLGKTNIIMKDENK
ncbi:MAG: DUF421 domain-containing protein [Ruminococcaceae bacterium]|nr:DUF421 domain-containing protein [Oscillospiraceae bacterium]